LIKKETIFVLTILFSSLAFPGRSQGIQIDHVITVVANLDSAISAYTNLGFTVKQGRLHDNGLINAHIKFKNTTSFELMSIDGEPTDEVAQEYTKLLESGEGGVYLAITGINTKAMEEKLDLLEISYNTTPGKRWNYITFHRHSGLAHIFFIDYHIKDDELQKNLTHENSLENISQVWIEGGDSVKYLFDGLGLKRLEPKKDPVLGDGLVYYTNTGEIILVPPKRPDERPRIKMVTFGTQQSSVQMRMRY
jgi:hypothetical protein